MHVYRYICIYNTFFPGVPPEPRSTTDMRGLLLAVALCLVLGLAGVAGKKEKVVLYDEVPYIECAVCREAVQAAWAGAEKLRQEKGKARPLSPKDICSP